MLNTKEYYRQSIASWPAAGLVYVDANAVYARRGLVAEGDGQYSVG